MKVQIKRVGVLSLAKLFAVMYAFIGILYGLIFFIASLVGGAMVSSFEDIGAEAALGPVVGLMALIFMPIFFAVLGFIGGLIAGFLYNLAFRFSGGLEIDMETHAIGNLGEKVGTI